MQTATRLVARGARNQAVQYIDRLLRARGCRGIASEGVVVDTRREARQRALRIRQGASQSYPAEGYMNSTGIAKAPDGRFVVIYLIVFCA